MNPSFFPTPHSSSEPAQSDVSSPSSSPSASSHSKRSSPIEFSPPETPTSQGGPRGPIFEPPARGSGLLTAEDEALLAAMSLVGRSRSRSSPANRRLPRGGSGLPPQHVPSSQLRRAISIDPRVEARAVEKRSAERMKAVGDTTERLGVLEREESGKRLDGMQTGIVAGEAEGGPGGLSILSPERGISERGLGSDKRLKRAEGESAGGAAPAWRNTTRPGGLYSASANKGEEELDKSVAEAERVPDDVHKGAATNFEQSSGRVQLDERPDASAEAPSEEGSGRVRNVNRGLVLQILGFEDEDDLEGFGRFLSPVRTKVSDANKSRLAKKRSNSFSEFSTIPSPPQMPARARGNIEREEWSPSRGRKGFGFAGSRARKQVPMQVGRCT